ncbi:hypothetical protein [Streptomyces mirabilis]|uniref:hypothetical protein n=1 Tax=Streptomyces mirabilis TaxID=68239 RepID=UPI003323AA67
MGSAEGILKTFTAFTGATSTIDAIAALGESPASMWTSRGGEGADAAVAAVRIGVLDPAVEDIAAAEGALDAVFERLPGEELTRTAEGVLDDAARQRTDPQGHFERFLQVRVLVEGEVLSGLDEVVDDVGDRDVEGRSGLGARCSVRGARCAVRRAG